MESIAHNTTCNEGLALIMLCHSSVPWFFLITCSRITGHWSKAVAAGRRSARLAGPALTYYVEPAESLLVAQAAPTNSTPFVRQPDFPLCRLLKTSLLSLVVSRDLD